MISSKEVVEGLNKLIPNPKCELIYNKDYELLISIVLSAQSTDKRVNLVTKELFVFNLEEIANMSLEEIEKIIKSVGTYHRKSLYIKEIANRLLNDYCGIVPNNRKYLENLPGVGRKTANVILSMIFDVPTIAVDTHVLRVSKRLELVNEFDDAFSAEQKLMKLFPKEIWNKLHLQLVLFGRYICKSKKAECEKCPFKSTCRNKKI